MEFKFTSSYKFPEGIFTIIWEPGEEEEYGYEIQLEFDKYNGEFEGVGGWTFGYEEWSYDVWTKWGEYIEKRTKEIEGNQESLDALIDELGDVDCHYLLYSPDDFLEHLQDLEVIKQLIAQ